MACRAALATGRSLTGGGSDRRESQTGHPCPVIEMRTPYVLFFVVDIHDSGLDEGKRVSEDTVASEEASGLREGKRVSEETMASKEAVASDEASGLVGGNGLVGGSGPQRRQWASEEAVGLGGGSYGLRRR